MYECECGGRPKRVNGEVVCQRCGRTTGGHPDPADSWRIWKARKTFVPRDRR